MELWKPAPDYEGLYEVSDLGRVRRIGKGYGATVGRVLKYKIDHRGYNQVSLYDARHRSRSHKVCRLITKAFVQNPLGKPEVNHINGTKTDDSSANLEWATRSENQLHAFKTGLQEPTFGEKDGMAILTEEQVLEIRRRYASGDTTYKALAQEYGMSHFTIGGIVRGESWKHLPI